MTSTPSPVQRLAALAVVAALIVGIAIAVSGGGGGSASATAIPQGRSVVDGLPERNGELGSPRARLVLTEYADLQCPVCKAFASRTLPTVVQRYVRTGKVRLALEPLSFLGGDSVEAGKAAAAAQEQGHLWPFLDRMFARQGVENSGWVTDDVLRSTATAAGISAERLLIDKDGYEAQERLDRADRAAQRHGIAGTPSFTVTRPGGEPEVLKADALDPDAFTRALDEALAR